jgi:SAM-dependent methyltransferase
MIDPNAYYEHGLAVEMYDLFTGQGLLAGDVAFYLDCARRFGGPILELGAGTGRVLLPLAQAGHDVTGLDMSPAMLDAAAAKLGRHPELSDHVRLIEGDMTAFDLSRHFALIIVSARSYQHIVTPEGQRAALHCMRRHLRPDGHLILDLFDANFELLFAKPDAGPPPREAPHPRSGQLVRRTIVARHNDPLRQTIREVLRFEQFDAAGNVVLEEETSWTLRWSMRQEIAYLLELCGFKAVEQFSDFSGSPPDYGREQLWIARAN